MVRVPDWQHVNGAALQWWDNRPACVFLSRGGTIETINVSVVPPVLKSTLTLFPALKCCSLSKSHCLHKLALLMVAGGVKNSSPEAAACPGPVMNSNILFWATSV